MIRVVTVVSEAFHIQLLQVCLASDTHHSQANIDAYDDRQWHAAISQVFLRMSPMGE